MAVLVCIFLAGCGGGLAGKWTQEAKFGTVTLTLTSGGDMKIDAPAGQDVAKYKVQGDKITITRLGEGEGEKTFDFKLEGDTLTIPGLYGDGVYTRAK
jgi:hypothetical protein